ncbi:MAG: fatty acid desaturase, partial [Woeseiaceae bacterium]|nr:fatty acid desaturase [Woeseiaceae bacterium]
MDINLHKKFDRAALKISREYSGRVGILTIILSVAAVFLYSAVLFLFANSFLPPLLTVPLLAVLTFISYTPMHEAVHGNISGKNGKLKWLDKAVGYLMAPIIAIPYTSHQKEHFTHHVHTNKDKDPDVHIKNWFNSPKHFFMGSIRIIKTQNTFVMNNYTKVEIFISLGWRLLFVFFTGLMSIPVLFLGWFSGAFLTLYLLSYLPHKPYRETTRYKNTNIRLFPIQWMEHLMFQHNLH